MKYTLASLAFGLGASAASIQRSCSFTLTASGGQSGTVGQLADGQNRVGGGYAPASYSIDNGAITDARGSGCILTPPTTQFQCDVGATPTGGFSIGSSGAVSHSGSTTFYACPATDSEYNIYTAPVAGQDKCVEIALTASGCYAPTVVTTTVEASCPAPSTVTVTSVVTAPAPSAPAPSTVTVTAVVTAPAPSPAPAKTTAPAAPVSTPKTCPANLSGNYQYPHLIVPVSSSSPNTAFGTQYNGNITPSVSSIYNFDIPSSYTGTCSLVFLFPEQKDLETSSFTFSGNGAVDFKQLTNVASSSTTFANQGAVKTDFGTLTVTPGSSTVVATFDCPAGQAVSYEISSASGTSLTYFQDYNPSPIGLYITSC